MHPDVEENRKFEAQRVANTKGIWTYARSKKDWKIEEGGGRVTCGVETRVAVQEILLKFLNDNRDPSTPEFEMMRNIGNTPKGSVGGGGILSHQIKPPAQVEVDEFNTPAKAMQNLPPRDAEQASLASKSKSPGTSPTAGGATTKSPGTSPTTENVAAEDTGDAGNEAPGVAAAPQPGKEKTRKSSASGEKKKRKRSGTPTRRSERVEKLQGKKPAKPPQPKDDEDYDSFNDEEEDAYSYDEGEEDGEPQEDEQLEANTEEDVNPTESSDDKKDE